MSAPITNHQGVAPPKTPAPSQAPMVEATPPPPKEMSTAMNVGSGVGLTCSAGIMLILAISFGNWLKKTPNGLNAAVTNTQKKAAHWFENGALAGKGGLILALIVLALLNGHVSYVAENPKKFMQDALATGGFGALAAVFLTVTRGRTDLWINHLIFALMLFFLYHVCREFAGYFSVFGNEPMTDQEKAEAGKLGKPILIIMGIVAVVMLGLAFTARVSPDYTTGILKTLSPNMALAIETIGFVAIISAGEIIVAKNHKDPIGPAIGMSALMFTFAHLVLQGGGFYEHLYMSPPDLNLN